MAEDAALHKRIDNLRDDVTRSIDVLRSEINTRFAEMSARLDERFRSTDKRVDDTNRRIDDLHHALSRQNTYMTIWFTILSLLVVLFGFLQ